MIADLSIKHLNILIYHDFINKISGAYLDYKISIKFKYDYFIMIKINNSYLKLRLFISNGCKMIVY